MSIYVTNLFIYYIVSTYILTHISQLMNFFSTQRKISKMALTRSLHVSWSSTLFLSMIKLPSDLSDVHAIRDHGVCTLKNEHSLLLIVVIRVHIDYGILFHINPKFNRENT